MSVLIALVDGADTVIACDGRASRGDGGIISDSVIKWHKSNTDPFAVGIAGSYRMIELMRENPAALDFLPDNEPSRIAKIVRQLAIDDDWKDEKADGKPRWYDLEILIARPGVVVSYDGILCSTVKRDHAAIGSGCDFALGALDVLVGFPMSAEGKARIAIEAACKRMSTCGGLVYVDRIALPVEGAA